MAGNEKIIAQNKKARHDYFIETEYEAGIHLKGTEIKSIRAGKVSINEAYILVKDGEIFVLNMHVAPYDFGNLFNHDETRTRKLLMHKKEILKLASKVKEDGYAIIPLVLYFNEGLAKLKIALAKGKKLYDKRETLKEKDAQKHIKKSYKEALKREA